MFFVVASIFLYAILPVFFQIWRVSLPFGLYSVSFWRLFVLFLSLVHYLLRPSSRLIILSLASWSFLTNTFLHVFSVFSEQSDISVLKGNSLFFLCLSCVWVDLEGISHVGRGGAAPSDLGRVHGQECSRSTNRDSHNNLNLLLFAVILNFLDGVKQ